MGIASMALVALSCISADGQTLSEYLTPLLEPQELAILPYLYLDADTTDFAPREREEDERHPEWLELEGMGRFGDFALTIDTERRHIYNFAKLEILGVDNPAHSEINPPEMLNLLYKILALDQQPFCSTFHTVRSDKPNRSSRRCFLDEYRGAWVPLALYIDVDTSVGHVTFYLRRDGAGTPKQIPAIDSDKARAALSGHELNYAVLKEILEVRSYSHPEHSAENDTYTWRHVVSILARVDVDMCSGDGTVERVAKSLFGMRWQEDIRLIEYDPATGKFDENQLSGRGCLCLPEN